MPFSQPSYGRIAGHLGDRFKMNCDKAGLQSHGACGTGRFTTGMACAND
jgi:hypothetical protein